MCNKLSKNKSRHHRLARFAGGGSDRNNISIVTKKRHRAYHLLFGHGDPHHVVREINAYWLDPAYKLVVVKR